MQVGEISLIFLPQAAQGMSAKVLPPKGQILPERHSS